MKEIYIYFPSDLETLRLAIGVEPPWNVVSWYWWLFVRKRNMEVTGGYALKLKVFGIPIIYWPRRNKVEDAKET